MAGIDPTTKVPARFIGNGTHMLPGGQGRVYDGNGKLIRSTVKNAMTGQRVAGVRTGDTIMVWPHEVYGQTYLHDPNQERQSVFVGIGHVLLPEHSGLSFAEAIAIGYEFHEPSANFEAVQPFTVSTIPGDPDVQAPPSNDGSGGAIGVQDDGSGA